jgi:hypothetical protein
VTHGPFRGRRSTASRSPSATPRTPPPGLVVRFENALRSLDRELASKYEWIDELTTEINRAQGELGKPFQHTKRSPRGLRQPQGDQRPTGQLAAAAAPPPAPAPATTDPDVAASLGVLASTHAAPPAGQHPGSNPSTARPYSPPAPENDSTISLD